MYFFKLKYILIVFGLIALKKSVLKNASVSAGIKSNVWY